MAELANVLALLVGYVQSGDPGLGADGHAEASARPSNSPQRHSERRGDGCPEPLDR